MFFLSRSNLPALNRDDSGTEPLKSTVNTPSVINPIPKLREKYTSSAVYVRMVLNRGGVIYRLALERRATTR